MIQEDIHNLASLSSEMRKAGFQDSKEGKETYLKSQIYKSKALKEAHGLTNIQKKVKWCGKHLGYDLTTVIFTNETSFKWGSRRIKSGLSLVSKTLLLKENILKRLTLEEQLQWEVSST